MAKIEERIHQREAELDAKREELSRREQGVADRETHTKQLQEDLKAGNERMLRELERVSGLTLAEARRQLLERSEDLVRHELARTVRQLEEEARTDAKRRARALIADALQRVAASHTAETTVSVVELASDDMKGRIISNTWWSPRLLDWYRIATRSAPAARASRASRGRRPRAGTPPSRRRRRRGTTLRRR